MRIISGRFRNHKLFSPSGHSARPTSEKLRGALFNICQNWIEGAHFLDLFAGSGAMGLEAISRGAEKAYFIEQDVHNIKCIKENISKLGVCEETILIQGDVFAILKKLHKEGLIFDIIYADPPYKAKKASESLTFAHKVLEFVDRFSLLSKEGTLFLEDAAGNFDEQKTQEDKLERLYLADERLFGHSLLRQYRIKDCCK